MKTCSPDKLILGHLNIIRLETNLILQCICQTKTLTSFLFLKLDDLFPLAQSKIEGFTTPYRYDKYDKGSDHLSYIREDIPSRLLQFKSQCNIESPSIEVNLRKRKWFLNCSHNPHRNSILNHLECSNHVIDEHSKTYEKFGFIGDFNIDIDENSMKYFCVINCLKSLIKVPTCFKNPDKPTCTDFILTNRPNVFQH